MLLLIALSAAYSPTSHHLASRASATRAGTTVTTARKPLLSRCTEPQCSLLADIASSPLLLLAAPLVSSAVWTATAGRPPIGAPYAPDANAYDPDAADNFYSARLPLVVNRLVQLTYVTGAFNVRLLFDLLAYKRAGSPEGEPWPNEADRAREALEARRSSQRARRRVSLTRTHTHARS